ncbi:MAG: peptidase M16, partial [Gammaproteobacteria bacterium]|nr:peptidase M16 [Gammaproteobacteria bacterium]
AAGTNGLVYTQLVYPMPALNEREQQLIPLLSHLVTELGLADQDYLTVQNRQTSVCGSIGFYTNLRATIDASQDCRAFAILSSKGLRKNIEPMVELLLDTAAAVRFDETKRIKDILTQVLARRESSVSSKGHVLAMNSAAAEISGLAQYHAMTTGLEGLVFMKQLVASLEDEAQLSQLAGEFQALYSKLTTAPSDILVIGEDESLQRMESALERLDRGNTESPIWSLKPKSQSKTKFWKINSTVNFCASAYPTVPSSHPDAAALTVLAGVLRNGFLHREIREKGGAYGGGATQDNGLASFKFYSYRDPRCKDTIEDFQRGIHWLIDNEVSFDQVEESILGVVSSLDKPASPAGEAKQSFYNVLHDRSPEFRREFRERILSVTTADLKRVANTYFVGVEPTVCVLGPESSLSELKDAVVYSL